MRAASELVAWSSPDAARWAFEHAPMPAAHVAALERRCLRGLGGAASEPLSDALAESLEEAAQGCTVTATDRAGRTLRLRCIDARAALWLVESVAAARVRLLDAIQCAAVQTLGPAIVHELQNPLNSACLRLEVLRHGLQRVDASSGGETMQLQLDGLRAPLHRLADLQAALVGRWLRPAHGAADAPQPLQLLLEASAGALRAHYAHRGARLEIDAAAGEGSVPAATAPALSLAISALLLMLAPRAGAEPVDAVSVHAGIDADGTEAIIDLPLPETGGVLGDALGWSCAELLAALGLVLHGHADLHAATGRLQVRVPLPSVEAAGALSEVL